MSDAKCPYCKAELKINHDDGYGYSEDVIYNQQCDVCGNTFVFETTIVFHYAIAKSSCLNGGEVHVFTNYRGYRDGKLCTYSVCGHCEHITPFVEVNNG